MFDYKGFSEEHLKSICSEENSIKPKAEIKYWTSEVYSQGSNYRDYANYPDFLPLYVYSEHGIEYNTVGKHEINNNAEAMFVFSDKKLNNYKKVSKKPCYKVMCPMIWFRQNNVKKSNQSFGTLAFPSHSTPNEICEFDVNTYVKQLELLPDTMKPICVCLHIHDIVKGQHKAFMELGIPVYSAGNPIDVRFSERFYDILKNFKYTTSNLLGSYAYYSVEMGIPFSLYGIKSKYFNVSDGNFPIGEYLLESDDYKQAADLFDGVNLAISEEQLNFVNKQLGCDSYLSREEMHKVLFKSYFRRGFYRIHELLRLFFMFILKKL